MEALDRYPDPVEQQISDRDNMFRDRERYFVGGRTALDPIRLAMIAIGKTEVENVLDLPSGHGRVMRWLKAEFPAARLAACDIDHDGVDFCSRTFGATPILGRADPAEIQLDDSYDLIWCGSLFTHLPLEQWDRFFDLFEAALPFGGLLVFTTHGREIAVRMRDAERGRIYMKEPEQREEILRSYETDGAGYRDYELTDEIRESLSLPSDYGISLTKPSYVSALIERRPHLQLVSYMEGAFNGQDAVACVRLPRGRKRDSLETLA